MIISITNQKGGVGKTTTAVNMADGLAKLGYKVLAIDLDSQASLSLALKVSNQEKTIINVLKKEISAKEAIHSTENLDVIPSNILLSSADLELNMTGREYLLKEAILPIKNEYDFIIFDTPPALSILTINALAAADKLVIPMNAELFSIEGMGQLSSHIANIRKYCNSGLDIEGVLMTRYNPRTVIGRDLKDKIQKLANDLNTKVFKTYIRPNISVQEAQLKRQAITDYDPRAAASIDYTNFIKEFIDGVKLNG